MTDQASSRVSLGVRRLLGALALALVLAPSASAVVAVAGPPSQVATEDLLTWHITGAPSDWFSADSQRSAQLEVVGPDHRLWRRQAFAYRAFRQHGVDADVHAPEYDAAGAPELQVRHTPRLPGAYEWSLQAPDGTLLSQGVFSAAASNCPMGPVGISRRNRHLLAWADGTVVIPLGCNIAWADAPDRVGRVASYLDGLVAGGGNTCRVWMASWSGQIEGASPDSWRLDQAWLLDQMLAAARARGVLVTVVLDNHYDLVHGTAFPYGASTPERQKAFLDPRLSPGYLHFLRYVLARWGCDDTILGWELFNELDMAQPVREACIPWVRAAAAALHGMDQDRRLRSVSWCGSDFDRIADVDSLDLTQVHRYVLEFADAKANDVLATRDGVGMLVEPAELARSIGKPFCFGELGFQAGADGNHGNELDAGGLLLRQQAWAGFMLGGYGSGMNWWWDTYIAQDKLWPVYQGMKAVLSQIDWSDPDLAPLGVDATAGGRLQVLGWLSPRQALIWPQPRADTWYRNLVQGQPRQGLAQRQTCPLPGLTPDARYDLTWFDMVSGHATGPSSVLLADGDGQGQLPVPAPDLDRVVLLKVHRP